MTTNSAASNSPDKHKVQQHMTVCQFMGGGRIVEILTDYQEQYTMFKVAWRMTVLRSIDETCFCHCTPTKAKMFISKAISLTNLEVTTNSYNIIQPISRSMYIHITYLLTRLLFPRKGNTHVPHNPLSTMPILFFLNGEVYKGVFFSFFWGGWWNPHRSDWNSADRGLPDKCSKSSWLLTNSKSVISTMNGIHQA